MRGAHFGAVAAFVMVAAVLGAGCDDLGRFSTGEGEAYCGVVTLAGAFRTGLSPRVQMRLTLDASALDGSDSPGVLSTFEAADETHEEQRLIDNAPLRPIAALAHDPLSHLEFGDGRERNAIFAVSPADPEAESMVAIVSLQTDDAIEVRLLRPGAAEDASGEAPPAERRAIFGMFRLTRQSNNCGF